MDNEKDQDKRQVYTYDPNTLYDKQPKQPRGPNWKKGLVIFLIIAVVVVGLGVACNTGTKRLNEMFLGEQQENYQFTSDYIGVLGVQGTISDSGDSSNKYNQNWLMKRVEEMKNDPMNQGLVLRVNTPGGSVYATDELYLKIEDYKSTGKPVYTYMESQAASGGYYLAMASDKIYANRNCWTGSIGVTIGTVYDFSGFLDKMGVKTVTITSGDNKAMGSAVDPLTREQKAIFQGLVDEAYDQFVGVVSQGRGMKESKVRKLADGRIYTAKQAKENGLIDEISTMEEAIGAMQKTYELEDCTVQNINYKPRTPLSSWINGLPSSESQLGSELDQMKTLMEENNKFTVTYFSNVRK